MYLYRINFNKPIMSQRTFLPKSFVSGSLTPLNYLRPMVLALISIPFVHYGPSAFVLWTIEHRLPLF